MHSLTPGAILQGAENNGDDPLDGVRLLVAANGVNGATGFVVSRPMNRRLCDLQEFSDSRLNWPLHWGGPVSDDLLFVWHCRADLIAGGELCFGNWHFGGNMSDVTEAIRLGMCTTEELFLFIGYCGWDAGELEEEAMAGEWTKAF